MSGFTIKQRSVPILRKAKRVGCVSFLMVGIAFNYTTSSANPEGGTVTAGSATITESGKKLDVHQQSQNAVIDWRSFDIGVDEHTEFHQPSSSSTALNRINDTNPSQIMGKLTANGNVV